MIKSSRVWASALVFLLIAVALMAVSGCGGSKSASDNGKETDSKGKVITEEAVGGRQAHLSEWSVPRHYRPFHDQAPR